MTEEAQPSPEQEVAIETPASLDDVISEFNVPVQTTTQTDVSPAQEFKPAQPAMPKIDPYDEDSLNQFATQTAQQTAALQSELQNLKDAEKARADTASQKIIDANIESAVNVISKGIEGIDPLAAEFILEKTARENAKFADLFRDQDKNPELYQKALDAIIRENDGKFQRVDTQLAENHRAAQQSQQSNNTQATTEYGSPLEEALAKATTEGERQVIWRNGKNLGY